MRIPMDPNKLRSALVLFRSVNNQSKFIPTAFSRTSFMSPWSNSSFQMQKLRYSLFSSATKASNESKQDESAAESENASKGETEAEAKLKVELEKAVAECAANLAKSRDFEDKYIRALAETENVRTRLTKQIGDAKLYAIQGFCKDMTEIGDILRMATESVPKEELNSNTHLKTLFDGLTMTESRLHQLFKTHGLTAINPIDGKFNPNEHEAVVHQAVEGKESGTVIFVSKLGYKLHDRVIRPAVVGVAK